MNEFLANIVCEEQDADSIREYSRKYFRQLRLRCRTERTYPTSAWNTPAIGAPIWVYVTVSVPKDQVLSSTALHKIADQFVNSLKDNFQSFQDFAIDFGPE